MKETILPGELGPAPDVSVRSLRELQARLRRRGIYAGMAVFFSTLVFLCLPDSVPWVELCRAGGVRLGFVFFAVACWFWSGYLREVHQMMETGLGPTRNQLVAIAWVGSGALLAEGLAWLMVAVTGHRWVGVLIRPLGACAMFLAWRWRQLARD